MGQQSRESRITALAEVTVLLGLILMSALWWVYDSIRDNRVPVEWQLPSGFELKVDPLIFGMQAALIAIAWRLSRKRRLLEAALEDAVSRTIEEKNRSEAIVAALGDGVSIQDREFRILYQNEAHRQMAKGSFLGQTCYRTYDSLERPCDDCPVEKTFRDGGVHRLEKKVVRKDQVIYIEIITSPLRDAKGEIVAAIELVRDISQHKLAVQGLARKAAELAVANQELEGFSYSLSHDLRSPLTRIYAAAQVLDDSDCVRSDPKSHFLIRTICEASEKMEELIEAILALSQVSRADLLLEEVDLTAIARETAAQLRLLDLERSVDFDIAPGLKAQGDPRLLKVVLENLLENAWKYSGKVPQARIEVGVREEEGRRVYFVRDNGAGFDMSLAGRLFKPFQRLHGPGDYPGTGIGLATVQRIIQRHGGAVWAEGSPERGATIFFTLP
jgi:PAS domain S-box-containing protein